MEYDPASLRYKVDSLTKKRSTHTRPQWMSSVLNERWSHSLRACWMLCAIALFGILIVSKAQADQLTLMPIDCPSDYFAGQSVKWELELASPTEQTIEIQWSMHVGSRTWARRSFSVDVKANQPRRVDIEFESPSMRDGISIEAAVDIKATGREDGVTEEWGQQIWFFPKDPFYASSQWLQQLDITLVDSVGRTAAVLDSLSVPFREISENQAGDENGLLMIGELTPWSPKIESAVRRAIDAGRPVLCFAMSEAQLDLMPPESDLPPEMSLHNSSFINQLDKRLSTNSSKSLCRYTLIQHKEKTLLRITSNEPGWSFVELMDTQSNGHLILCGMSIRPNTSPTETYLFARLLERICPTKPISPEPRK